MARQETDFPVSELMARYELVRSQVYARINALKAKNSALAPFKIGVKSYVNEAVLGCLDEMHRLITNEELTTEEAAETVAGSSETSIEPAPNKAPYSTTIQKTTLSGGAIAASEKTPITAIQEALQSQPLVRYELLDKAAERDWLLPTSEITELLGMKSVSGHEFERYGFRFIQMGKAGAENTWKIEKLQ